MMRKKKIDTQAALLKRQGRPKKPKNKITKDKVVAEVGKLGRPKPRFARVPKIPAL